MTLVHVHMKAFLTHNAYVLILSGHLATYYNVPILNDTTQVVNLPVTLPLGVLHLKTIGA